MNSSIKNIPHAIYNVGTGKNYSIIEVANMLDPGSSGVKKITLVPARLAEVNETLADISRTTKDLGWKPVWSLEDKINDY